MNTNFYYNKKNPKFHEMELNEKGYPIWKDSGKLVHIYQAEKYIVKGRLNDNEVVHHVDGDKLNYDVDNLIILSREDHNKIEQDLWKYTNVMTLHFFVIFLSYAFLVSYLFNGGIYLISATLFLLLIALLIPFFPRTLRKFLFKTKILRKNKQNRSPFQ